jgi:hypothetical protein
MSERYKAREEHEEDRSRYAVGFLVMVVIIAASIVAVALKCLLVWLGT